MNDRDDAHLLSGAYALDAVTPEEAAAVEAAMRTSDQLREEVVGLADTAVTLGLSVPESTPPDALRARLLAAIGDVPQHPADEAEPEPAMPAGDHVVPHRRRRRRPMVVMASLVAAVLLFTGGVLVQRTIVQPDRDLTSITAASDVRTATASVKGGGTATVYWSRSEHRTAVELTDVTAPSGRVLQLWSLRDGTTTDAGLYQPMDGQHFTLIAGTPSAGERLAVSVEPAGGSSQPTTTPIATVTL